MRQSSFGLLIAAILLLFPLSGNAQVAVIPSPQLPFVSLLQNGTVNANGCVQTVISGTSTPLPTYTDSTGLTQNSNPVILSANGTAQIWIQSGQAYQFNVKSFGGVNCASGSTVTTVKGISGGLSQAVTIVPFSSTPSFVVSAQNQVFQMTLTGNAAALPMTFVGVSAPTFVTFQITQDSVGNHTFTYPSNVTGGSPINPVANSTTTQLFLWNGTTTVAVGPGSTTGGAFTGSGSFLSINSMQMCDQQNGATADLKIQACIAALPLTGGIADARGLIGTQTIASEIDVGNSTSRFVNLILPCGAVWNVTINNGTTSALKVFGGSSIVSLNCAQNSAFQLKLAATGNVTSLVTNDQTCSSCSLKLNGMMLYNTLGGIVVNAMMDLSNLGNNAEVSSINIATFKTKGLWIHGGNSESTFTAINVDGGQTSGAVPCTIETSSASLETLRFFALDCQHPGVGQNELVINGHGTSSLAGLSFYGSHFEGSNTDTTTPFVALTDARDVTFYSPFWNSLDSGTTNYGLQISQSGANLTDNITVIGALHGNGNFINDTIRSKLITGTGGLPYYNYTAANSNVFGAFLNGTVMTEIAAPSNSNPGGVDSCYGDSTAHVERCQWNSGNYHSLRLMEVGTCTMVAGTCTVTWSSAFASTPLCFSSWTGSGVVTGFTNATPSTTNCIVTSSINTNTGVFNVIGVGNPN